MNVDDILQSSDDAVAREVGGEMVLMHLSTGTYFGLKGVGSMIWQLIEERPRAISELRDAVAAEYDAPAELIEQDILALAEDLVAHGLITRIAA